MKYRCNCRSLDNISVGLEEQGIYKKPSLLSKANSLVMDCIGVYIHVCLYKTLF